MQRKIILAIAVAILSLPAIWFLFLNGFVATDDGNWMIIRFSAFYQALADGQFPVRFLGRLNFGYGYPVAEFLYPGFMYLAVPFKMAGLSFVDSIKVIIGGSVVLSGVFAYFWLNSFFDDVSSFFGSLLYVYTPYHVYDLTKRGSVGELLSIAVMPFILWQLERKNTLLASLGIAMLIISHNTLALLFLGVLVLYMGLSIYVVKKKKPIAAFFAKTLLFGAGLAAFFWIPAVAELPYTVFFKTTISNVNEYFATLDLVGITTLLIFVMGTGVFIVKREFIKKHPLTILFLILGIVSVFLSTSVSSFIWSFLPVSFVQFPFRLLSVSMLSAVFVGAFLLSITPFKYRLFAGVIVILATVFLSREQLVPGNFNLAPDSFYSTNEATTTVAAEYMPKWVMQEPLSHFKTKAEIIKGEGVISNIIYNSENITFNYNSGSPSVVRVNTIYYPGWRAWSNNNQKAIFYDNEAGVMDLKLTEGKQAIRLNFAETPLRVIANLISLVALFSLVLSLGLKHKLPFV